MKSQRSSRRTTRPIACSRRSACSTRCSTSSTATAQRHLEGGRDHRLDVPVFHAQGTARSGAEGKRAPRNSYELAFRNQFFTPRYVVEFLTDNTLGRIWYEMRKGDTALKEQCRYMVCRPNEVFLAEGEKEPESRRWQHDLHPLPREERPATPENPRPGLRQRPLPALLLRSAANDLRGSLRRSRPRPGTPAGLSRP